MRLSFAILSLSTAVLLSACGSAPKKTEPTPPPPTVVSAARQGEANLAPASASIVSGRIALMVSLAASTSPAWSVACSRCSRPASTSTSVATAARWMPAAPATTSTPPGLRMVAGTGKHHLGDMDNLRADAQGRANVDIHLKGVTLGGGAATDIAGRALVVHANADDYRSQPAGNAGVRIACGVIRVVR